MLILIYPIIMLYLYGWTAGTISLIFILLMVYKALCEENKLKDEFRQEKWEFEKSCQKTYTDILNNVPAAASSIASYYWDKEDDNFLIRHSKIKSSVDPLLKKRPKRI